MRPWARRAGLTAGLIFLALVLAIALNMRPGNPQLFPVKPGERAIPVYVVSHGYHSGLVLRHADLRREAQDLPVLQGILDRFALYDDLEFGWGDEGFYRQVRTLGDLQIAEGLRALFMPGNRSVMHVVGISDGARLTFPAADILLVQTSSSGFAHLVAALDQSFARDDQAHAEELGQGLYGPSLFYRANGTFNLSNVCNHWVAQLLDAAGVPNNPILSILPKGMFLDLAWRTEARMLPRP